MNLPVSFHKYMFVVLLISLTFYVTSCGPPEHYDTILRGCTIYDGSGNDGYTGDVALRADTIAAVGNIGRAVADTELDVKGLAVAPGFINMLSWATESLIEDGRSQSEIRQGVTLEVMGEGFSMGPLNEEMKEEMIRDQGDIKFDIAWNTLGEYLEFLENKGVSTNITSFIGTATVRQYVMGMETRPPDEEELEQMRALVRQAMEEGAVGVSSALIYVPGSYAKTEELVELAKVASSYDGMYISHVRSEEEGLLEALGELIYIAKTADIPAEVYHFKASGRSNWNKLDTAIHMIEDALNSGLHITTDMYTYRASSTGLNTVLPDWALEGGIYKTIERFKDPETKAKILKEIDFRCPPDSILLVGFKNQDLRHLNGKSLGEIARMRGIPDEEAVAELIVEDNSRIQAVFFTMSEGNVKKKIALPFMSFCSDAGSIASEGVFLNSSVHPRTYGSFARLLGKYVRDEKIIPLKEAIRRLTAFPAENLKIKKRGRLKEGYYADVVVFDPLKIQDHATFQNPHQYATGVKYVWVNGVQVLRDGEHTGALPGRVVRGPGWK